MYRLPATSHRTRTAYSRFTSNNWSREDYYEGKGPGINGQGDDGPSHFGRSGEGGAQDAAVLVKKQDGVVALLVAVDARREKQLASERVLEE